jgi:hypothetical protein
VIETGRMSGGPLSPGAALSWSATGNCLLLVLKKGRENEKDQAADTTAIGGAARHS